MKWMGLDIISMLMESCMKEDKEKIDLMEKGD
jgi:hypothetical protein